MRGAAEARILSVALLHSHSMTNKHPRSSIAKLSPLISGEVERALADSSSAPPIFVCDHLDDHSQPTDLRTAPAPAQSCSCTVRAVSASRSAFAACEIAPLRWCCRSTQLDDVLHRAVPAFPLFGDAFPDQLCPRRSQKELSHPISLHPSFFGPQTQQFLERKLLSDVEGTCTGPFTLLSGCRTAAHLRS